MLGIRFENDVDQKRDEGVGSFFTGDVPYETCKTWSVSRNALHCVVILDSAISPKMTLQQFKTQIILSLGAL